MRAGHRCQVHVVGHGEERPEVFGDVDFGDDGVGTSRAVHQHRREELAVVTLLCCVIAVIEAQRVGRERGPRTNVERPVGQHAAVAAVVWGVLRVGGDVYVGHPLRHQFLRPRHVIRHVDVDVLGQRGVRHDVVKVPACRLLVDVLRDVGHADSAPLVGLATAERIPAVAAA